MVIPEIIGNIMVALADVTGTKGMINAEDIPIVFRYASAYCITCKEIYNACNNHSVVTVFFESLACRFGNSPEHYAPFWNIKASRKLLVDFLESEKYIEIYNKFAEIRTLFRDINKEVFDVETYSKKGMFLQISETVLQVISPLGT